MARAEPFHAKQNLFFEFTENFVIKFLGFLGGVACPPLPYRRTLISCLLPRIGIVVEARRVQGRLNHFMGVWGTGAWETGLPRNGRQR